MASLKITSAALIGVDTNILVRLLTRDDAGQYASVVDLVTRARKDGPLFVNPVVIAELAWVLERRYEMSPEKARPLIKSLLHTVEFRVPDLIKMDSWVSWLSSPHKGFSDVMIAAINTENGCQLTYTFDQDAAKSVPGMELLT
ncbi:MAG: PIN domain-containing protein [Rhizobiaceae bacterium]